MSRHCCVPGCKSYRNKGYKKNKFNISFHEFPSRSPARDIWIEAVRNQFEDENSRTWHPDERTLICSLHFSPDQFRDHTRKTFLKRGSVPHIFLDYYTSKNGNLENEEDILPIKLNENRNKKCIKYSEYNKMPSAVNCNKRSHSNPKIVTLQAASSSLQKTNDSLFVSDSVEDNSSCSSVIIENSDALNSGISENQNISTHFDAQIHNQNFSKEQPVFTNLSCFQDDQTSSALWAVKEVTLKTSSTQTAEKFSAMQHSGLKRKYKDEDEDDDDMKKLRQTINKLKAQVLNLEQQNENLRLLNQRNNESLKLFKIKELEKGITDLDARALFLFEQLTSFTKKKTVWSRNTIKVIDTLEADFPEAYEYLKQSDILNFPPSKNERHS